MAGHSCDLFRARLIQVAFIATDLARRDVDQGGERLCGEAPRQSRVFQSVTPKRPDAKAHMNPRCCLMIDDFADNSIPPSMVWHQVAVFTRMSIRPRAAPRQSHVATGSVSRRQLRASVLPGSHRSRHRRIGFPRPARSLLRPQKRRTPAFPAAPSRLLHPRFIWVLVDASAGTVAHYEYRWRADIGADCRCRRRSPQYRAGQGGRWLAGPPRSRIGGCGVGSGAPAI